MNELYIFICIFFNLIFSAYGSDVLGCGGFIKSHVQIDFSKVEVKLFTKQGILKDKTNCAPNNGYYFVPLYDKGEYILQLEPPAGWSFNPTKVNLNVDGVSDLCSQGKDINFVFKGFGITGKVESVGTSNKGPQGVEVVLKSNLDVRTTITDNEGHFFFTPVYPGSYTVSISHTKWKIYKKSLEVVVTEGNTDLPTKSFLVQGYDVSGTITSEGEPVKDTSMMLFQKGQAVNVLVDGCNKESLPKFPGENQPICFVTSNENGVFTFGTVPNGHYYIIPYYREQNIHFKPDKIEFFVEHQSVVLKQNFEIIGFNIKGYVLKSEGGGPLANAKIFLDNTYVTKTDLNGAYMLEKLKVGTYKLKAEADGFMFNEVRAKINSNSKKMPDLFPTSYKVCGSVISDQSQPITFDKIGSTQLITTVSNANNGSFCEFLSPGKYDVQVVVNSDNKQRGMQFFPIKQTIEVNYEQISNIVFSQLKATVSGKLLCIRDKDCEGLKINVKPIGTDAPGQNIIVDVQRNSYTVSKIYPGNYEITLFSNKLCWKTSQQTINVNNITVSVPPFVQTGYSVNFLSSHKTKVAYKTPDGSESAEFEIVKGRSPHCIKNPGQYNFVLDSCHSYESNTIPYNSEFELNEVVLTAQKHTVILAIKSEENHGKIQVSIKVGSDKIQIEPVYVDGQYEVKMLLSPLESAVVVPQSNILYFTPPILSVSGSEDCANFGVKFKAIKGKVFKGKVVPALQGVMITVESENTESLLAETNPDGTYKFPPLDDSKEYKVTAKKDSYVLVGPNDEAIFFAHKLAEIVVEVVAEIDKMPLQGALLSLSGGESYRSNLQTNENGKITFHSLSPNEYFLRPMMKEYKFEPNSKIIPVKEGQTVNVQLIGKRVAYSAFGQVTSLNGLPEDNMIIVASGVNNCSHFSEESTSESTGQFRIRGLQPNCSYEIRVKSSTDEKQIIERSAPSSIYIENVHKDVKDLKIIVFRPVNNMDVLVKVFAENPDHYKNLRVKFSRESAPSGLVHTYKIDTSSIKLTKHTNKGVLLHVLSVPIDGKTYSVQIESSQLQSTKWKPQTVYFNANSSFKYVELDFVVKSNTVEQHIKQTSIWTLVLIFGIIFALYNIELIGPVLKEKLNFNVNGLANFVPSMSNKKTNEYFDNAEIDQIVQSINNVKRKNKPKKA